MQSKLREIYLRSDACERCGGDIVMILTGKWIEWEDADGTRLRRREVLGKMCPICEWVQETRKGETWDTVTTPEDRRSDRG